MPRVVVVPFGVPEEAEGLGIGLAALVHGFVRVGGDHVGLAQLLSKDSTKAVEAFVPPAAWKELSANGPDPGPLAGADRLLRVTGDGPRLTPAPGVRAQEW